MCLPPEGAMELATALIIRVEGEILHPYLDTGGTWTIGSGLTRYNGQPVTGRTAPITHEQNMAGVAYELGQTARLINAVVMVDLSVGEWAALASFAFNEGGPRFAKSDLLKFVNKRQMDDAEAEFPKWDIVAGKPSIGLLHRRMIEKTVFASGKIPDAVPASPSIAGAAPQIAHVAVPVKYMTADDLNAMQLASLGNAG